MDLVFYKCIENEIDGYLVDWYVRDMIFGTLGFCISEKVTRVEDSKNFIINSSACLTGKIKVYVSHVHLFCRQNRGNIGIMKIHTVLCPFS